MRVSKKHDVRLNEILDAAAQLFMQKGYESTTVNDILEKVEIGKGTFYHYFNSKEEVMNAVIDRVVEHIVQAARAVAETQGLDALEKTQRIILSLNISNSPNAPMIDELHQPSNALMHQESIARTIKAVAPILADAIRQGICEGVFNTDFPQETIEFLLAANQFVLDDGIFHWSPEEMGIRAVAFVRMMELSLGAGKDSFQFILTLLTQN